MKKTNITEITFSQFLSDVESLAEFNSITGRNYRVLFLEDEILHFVRMSSDKNWKMDLRKVYQAYQELSDFKVANFKNYLPRTQSPALGLLISLNLIIN
ncbi:hypothetical protein [Epilithonimonas xixisoli]|uniref:Uncharacterized protein n=1 Tax=Epilithonimonas xixisoli TaxID=1476462 RepID=A0A4R8II43_9FLAO|nr:hypothetical protein [Epilithonimonas xixisoli]TDX86573.1 hypothetical protein B0I22_0707 [Epilithonimonas xixisoli]